MNIKWISAQYDRNWKKNQYLRLHFVRVVQHCMVERDGSMRNRVKTIVVKRILLCIPNFPQQSCKCGKCFHSTCAHTHLPYTSQSYSIVFRRTEPKLHAKFFRSIIVALKCFLKNRIEITKCSTKTEFITPWKALTLLLKRTVDPSCFPEHACIR